MSQTRGRRPCRRSSTGAHRPFADRRAPSGPRTPLAGAGPPAARHRRLHPAGDGSLPDGPGSRPFEKIVLLSRRTGDSAGDCRATWYAENAGAGTLALTMPTDRCRARRFPIEGGGALVVSYGLTADRGVTRCRRRYRGCVGSYHRQLALPFSHKWKLDNRSRGAYGL